MFRYFLSFVMLACLSTPAWASTDEVMVGAYYFPGWKSDSPYWNDLKGLKGSRSPGVAWPEREPLLGWYAEENRDIAEAQVDQAVDHGIDFFAFDWYWSGTAPYLDHALTALEQARNRERIRYCLMWANHSSVPNKLAEFDAMVSFWIERYFSDPQYVLIKNKPLVYVFSPERLARNSQRFGYSVAGLLERANNMAINRGLPGVYFVAISNEKPSDRVELQYLSEGFSAYTGWSYHLEENTPRIAEYRTMVDTYLRYYRHAATTGAKLPYFPPASPGWDARPWNGAKSAVRTNSTPALFETMLHGAQEYLTLSRNSPKILMVQSWNEFAEGTFIAPTKKWGFQHLLSLKAVFRKKRHP